MHLYFCRIYPSGTYVYPISWLGWLHLKVAVDKRNEWESILSHIFGHSNNSRFKVLYRIWYSFSNIVIIYDWIVENASYWVNSLIFLIHLVLHSIWYIIFFDFKISATLITLLHYAGTSIFTNRVIVRASQPPTPECFSSYFSELDLLNLFFMI